jgi:hypothetical protein
LIKWLALTYPDAALLAFGRDDGHCGVSSLRPIALFPWNICRCGILALRRCVFYLRYRGYAIFFPLWALARYRNLTRGNSREVAFGL